MPFSDGGIAVVAHRVVELGLGEEGLGGEVELLAARAHAVHVASDVPERRAEHAAQPGVRPREPRATPGEIEGGRRRGRLLVRHARRRARRRRRGPESRSQRAAHLDALQRAARAPGSSGATRARATPKSVPPAQRAFERVLSLTGAGGARASSIRRLVDRASCLLSKSATSPGTVIATRPSHATARVSPRLASSLDLHLASRLVRSGQCHTVCFTATPGYPLHTFPTSGCHPIAAGRRLGWV